MAEKFPTTTWTLISAAAGNSAGAPDALERLCGSYWSPVYGFVRRKGHSREEAEDLTQEFFAWVLQRGWLGSARRDGGRFRSFLLASLTNFLSNEWDRSQAQKRSPGTLISSLEFHQAEQRYNCEPSHQLTPEAVFERQWAITLLDRVLANLREEQLGKATAVPFERIQSFLSGSEDRGAYEQLAADLALTPGALRTAVHRLRRRYAELVREEIAALVVDPSEVEGELRFLLAALDTPP